MAWIVWVGLLSVAAGGDPPAWTPAPPQAEGTMTIVAAVLDDGVESTDPGDLLAAFVDDEVRGTARPVAVGPSSVYFVSAWGRPGERLTFRFYDASRDLVVDLPGEVLFEESTVLGTASIPHAWEIGDASLANRPTWIPVSGPHSSSMSMVIRPFVDQVPADRPTDLVAAFAGSELRGVATPVRVGSRTLHFLTVEGSTAGEPISFRIYDSRTDRVVDGDRTIPFAPDVVVAGATSPWPLGGGSVSGPSRPTWVADPSGYDSGMTIVAAVAIDGRLADSPNLLAAAFVGDEVRGSAAPIDVAGAMTLFMTVYGSLPGESVTVKVYDPVGDRILDANEPFVFEPGAALGSTTTPVVWNATSGPQPDAPEWAYDPSAWERTMALTGTLVLDGAEAGNTLDRVAAFAGDEIRGTAEALVVRGRVLFTLPVHSNSPGEQITLRAWDAASGSVRRLAGSYSFDPDAVLGSPTMPLAWIPGGGDSRPDWSSPPATCPSTMQITLTLELDGLRSDHPDNLLAAFAGSEFRGYARPIPDPTGDGRLFVLTVCGDSDGETIEFAAYDALNDTVRRVQGQVAFLSGSTLGSFAAPVRFVGDRTTRAPEARDDAARTVFATAVEIDVLANDVDADGDPITLIDVIGLPSNGLATLTAGATAIRYVPQPGFAGTDSFGYEISAGGETATATVTVTVGCDLAGDLPWSECEALVDVYQATGGPSWTQRTGWLGSGSPCAWSGVECAGGHVAALRLPSNHLAGELPGGMGRLSSLSLLDLFGNELTGSLPDDIGSIAGLRTMELSFNRFTGSLPESFGALSNLDFFSVYNNELSGAIPSSFGGLTAINLLQLGNNRLTGPIPASVAGLPGLRFFFAAGNSLSGPIPASIADYPRSAIDLTANRLTGTLPTEIGLLTGLTLLQLGGNLLEGVVPLSVAQVCASIGPSCGIWNAALCIPDQPAYRALGLDVIGGIPLSTSCGVAPVANDDEATATSGTPTSIQVLANDSHPAGRAIQLAAVQAVTDAGGTAAADDAGTPADGSDDFVVYTSPDTFEGEDFFEYTVGDGQGGYDTARVRVVVTTGQRCVAVSYGAGWNLVSTPVSAQPAGFQTLFGQTAPAFAFAGSYVAAPEAVPGRGYFLKFASATDTELCGDPAGAAGIPVASGWNIIGPFDVPVATASIASEPASIVASAYFGFSGAYSQATTLQPGRGYFVKATATGRLVLGAAGKAAPGTAERTAQGAGRTVGLQTTGARDGRGEAGPHDAVLTFSTRDASPISLLLTPDDTGTAPYGLPPVPPSSAFDARFDGDVTRRPAGPWQLVRIQGPDPVDLTPELPDGRALELRMRPDGPVRTLASGDRLSLPAATSMLWVRSADPVVPETGLLAGYPNPFFDEVRIGFTLADAAHVSIRLFDALGRQVATLLDEDRPAGAGDVAFSAVSRGLPSGPYFVSLTAGSRVDTRTLVLSRR